jgi:hypothetical protein
MALRVIDAVVSFRFGTDLVIVPLERPFFKAVEFFFRFNGVKINLMNGEKLQMKAGCMRFCNRTLTRLIFIDLMISLIVAWGVAYPVAIVTNCRPATVMQIPLYLFFGILTALSPYFAWLMRSSPDTIGIRTENIIVSVSMLVGLLVYLAFSILNVTKDSSSIWSYKEFYLLIFDSFIPVTMIGLYPVILILLNRYKGKSALAQNEESFIRTLKNEKLYKMLKKEVHNEFSMENIMFYETVRDIYTERQIPLLFGGKALNNVKVSAEDPSEVKLLETSNTQELLAKIYSRFIAPNSELELNISNSLKEMFIAEMNSSTPSLAVLSAVNNDILCSIYVNAFSKLVRNQGDQLKTSCSLV